MPAQHLPWEVSAHIPDRQGHSLESLSPITPSVHSLSHVFPAPASKAHDKLLPASSPLLGIQAQTPLQGFLFLKLYVLTSLTQSLFPACQMEAHLDEGRGGDEDPDPAWQGVCICSEKAHTRVCFLLGPLFPMGEK